MVAQRVSVGRVRVDKRCTTGAMMVVETKARRYQIELRTRMAV
jgi:hypothetical protein